MKMRLLQLVIKHKKISIPIAIVIILIIGLGITLNKLEQPSNVQAVIGQPVSDQLGYSINLTPATFKDSYVTFKYPKGLTQKRSNPLGATDVDIIEFSARDVLSWILSIDLTNTGLKPLSDDSSYSLRLNEPTIYKLSTLNIGDQTIPVMTNMQASGFSEVAFLRHDNLRATVSLIGDDADGLSPLQTTWNMILNSWRWQ